MREPFPLQWPDGWARTPDVGRLRSRFGVRGQVSFDAARRDMLLELQRLGAANVVLTTSLPVRRDGIPYAASGRSEDPGVAVWFLLPDANGSLQERVFACDKWKTHAENMTSIARSIEALRGLDRWGASDVVTRAFAGFNALPPGSGDGDAAAPATKPKKPKKPWWMVLDVDYGLRCALHRDDLLVIVKARHRSKIKEAHPDAGGDHDLAAELNAALAEAELESKGWKP